MECHPCGAGWVCPRPPAHATQEREREQREATSTGRGETGQPGDERGVVASRWREAPTTRVTRAIPRRGTWSDECRVTAPKLHGRAAPAAGTGMMAAVECCPYRYLLVLLPLLILQAHQHVRCTSANKVTDCACQSGERRSRGRIVAFAGCML